MSRFHTGGRRAAAATVPTRAVASTVASTTAAAVVDAVETTGTSATGPQLSIPAKDPMIYPQEGG